MTQLELIHRIYSLRSVESTNLVYSFPLDPSLPSPFNTLYCESRPYQKVQIDLASRFSREQLSVQLGTVDLLGYSHLSAT
jgi:hypothetical protein